jgi:hypothetical protein
MKNPLQKLLTIGTWRFPLIGGKGKVKQFEIRQVGEGIVLQHRLFGTVEIFQGAGVKPPNTLRLSIPSVFGKPKVLTIGTDWVKIGNRLFRAETAVKKG